MVTEPHSMPVKISSAEEIRGNHLTQPANIVLSGIKSPSGGERASVLWQLHGQQGIQLFWSLLLWAVNWHKPVRSHTIPQVFLVKNSRIEVLPKLCYQVTWKASLRTKSITKADIYLVFLFLFPLSPFIPPILFLPSPAPIIATLWSVSMSYVSLFLFFCSIHSLPAPAPELSACPLPMSLSLFLKQTFINKTFIYKQE